MTQIFSGLLGDKKGCVSVRETLTFLVNIVVIVKSEEKKLSVAAARGCSSLKCRLLFIGIL